MSVGTPAAVAPPASTTKTGTSLSTIVGLFVPGVTIIGLIVLLALGKIDQAAALGLIGALAGLHGGVAVANATSG